MLETAPVCPSIAVTDLDRALKFYTEGLGLKLQHKDEQTALLQAGHGTMLLLYWRPNPPVADHTLAGFAVENIEAVVAELKARGVPFEEYDLPNLKTDNSIAVWGDDKSAWFKDPDGNIFALHQGDQR